MAEGRTQRKDQYNFAGVPLAQFGGGGGGFQPNFGVMPAFLNQLSGAFPSAMGGAMNQIAGINAGNAARAGNAGYDDRDLRAFIAQLQNQANNYQSDAYRDVGMEQARAPSQAGIYQDQIGAQGDQNVAIAQMLAQLGASQNQAVGGYLSGLPAAEASMYNTATGANAQRDVQGMQSIADILQAAISANLQYALAPAQMGSNERIAGIQNQGNLYNALASQYGARQGATASMYGANQAADAARYSAGQQSIADILASQLGYRGLLDTNASGRYGADQQLAGQALGHQLGFQGLQDTNRTNLAMNQGTNQTNLGIAGLGAGAQRYGTVGDVLSSRLGLEGTRETAGANRYGAQQNALASMFGSGAGLQSNREQEQGKNKRFDTAANLFSSLLGRFSSPPQFGGFQTNYGAGARF